MNGGGSKLERESRSLLNELPGFDKGGFLDLGHPLLNRMAESFLKAAGVRTSLLVSAASSFPAADYGCAVIYPFIY